MKTDRKYTLDVDRYNRMVDVLKSPNQVCLLQRSSRFLSEKTMSNAEVIDMLTEQLEFIKCSLKRQYEPVFEAVESRKAILCSINEKGAEITIHNKKQSFFEKINNLIKWQQIQAKKAK
jgi:hypothetical protein